MMCNLDSEIGIAHIRGSGIGIGIQSGLNCSSSSRMELKLNLNQISSMKSESEFNSNAIFPKLLIIQCLHKQPLEIVTEKFPFRTDTRYISRIALDPSFSLQ